MAPVRFDIRTEFAVPPRVLWDELVDWQRHESWIPATRVKLDPGDPTVVGATFTAYTGYGPLTLEDRMRVARREWNEDTRSGVCAVEKLGPVLHGRAGFTVEPATGGSTMLWTEDVTVRKLPGLLAPIATRLSVLGFESGMRKLARTLESSTDHS